MNEQLPYEENLKQGLNDVPLPDENQAWQKMKQLLDKDDEDRIIPPIFMKSCMGWGLLLLTGIIIVWLVYHPENYLFSINKKEVQKDIVDQPVQTSPEIKSPPSNPGISSSRRARPVILSSGNNSVDSLTIIIAGDKKNKLSVAPKKNDPLKNTINAGRNSSKISQPLVTSTARKIVASSPKRKIQINKANGERDIVKSGKPMLADTLSHPQKQSNHQKEKGNLPLKDSIKTEIKKIDSPVVHKPLIDSTATALQKPVKKYYLSAGIGLYQPLPIGGQKSSPYNQYGRKNSWTDYIPSVYVRLHNKEKWQIHTEFRYGAPQNVKDVAYEQNSFTTFDSSGGSLTTFTNTNTSRLKKTFYHQVPLTFDYFIRTGWSVGAGIMYSRFFSAVTEEEARRKNNTTQAETISSKITRVALKDSSSYFTRSQVHILINTEFKWKKLSAGIRYSQGIQPFIRYNTPTGTEKQEKIQAFDLFIRFRLWKEKT